MKLGQTAYYLDWRRRLARYRGPVVGVVGNIVTVQVGDRTQEYAAETLATEDRALALDYDIGNRL